MFKADSIKTAVGLGWGQQLAKANCNECGQAFLSKKGLKFYLLRFRGEKSGKCEVQRSAGWAPERTHAFSHWKTAKGVLPNDGKTSSVRVRSSATLLFTLALTNTNAISVAPHSIISALSNVNMTTAHKQQKTHQCFVCSFTFCSRGTLNKHLCKKYPGIALSSVDSW